MKNLLFIFTLVFAGTLIAQQKEITPEDLYGHYIGKLEATVISFKDRQRCEIKTLLGQEEVASQWASWEMISDDRMVFTDDKGNFLFELDHQKGNWYLRNKERNYTFSMVYIPLKEVGKPRKGEGC